MLLKQPYSFSSNADRAPQLKADVGLYILLMAKVTSILIGILLFPAWAGHAQTLVPPDTLITLRRITDAFNNGTDYRLTINADGTVVFKRIANPAVDISDPRARASGPTQTRIPVHQVALLVAEVERIKYFSLKDRYGAREDGCPNVFDDQGGAEISITINGKTKSIGHYHGCGQEPFGPAYPLDLTALEEKIDEIAGTKQWLKTINHKAEQHVGPERR